MESQIWPAHSRPSIRILLFPASRYLQRSCEDDKWLLWWNVGLRAHPKIGLALL